MPATQLTLEQLIAFNDELVALARAGIPLDRGMAELGRDLRGKLGRLATEVGERLERGESLQQLVAARDPVFPPLYCAVIDVGIRGGNLAAALSGLAETMRRTQELGRLAWWAAIYPLVVLAAAYSLFLFALWNIMPLILETHDWFQEARPIGAQVLARLRDTMPYWAIWPPLLMLVLIVWELRRQRRLAVRGVGRWPSPLARALRHARLMTFTRTVELLVKHELPLAEGLELAGGVSGDPILVRGSRELSGQIRSGAAPSAPPGFPGLLGSVLATATSGESLRGMLHRLGDDYERLARRDAVWLTRYLPAILTIVIGGSAVAVFCIALLGPWIQVLYRIGELAES